MRRLLVRNIILLGFLVCALALTADVHAARKSPSAPKVKNCAIFLGAPTEGLAEGRSTPEQLATSYVKILEWLLERKLITLEEAQETINSSSPAVPQNYIGLSENYHAANQGLKMLVAQMNTEKHHAWTLVKSKASQLIEKLTHDQIKTSEAKVKTKVIFAPRIVETIDLKKLIKSSSEITNSNFLGASRGRIAWAIQDETGKTWAGINNKVFKLPNLAEPSVRLTLTEVGNGRIILALDADNRKGDSQFIILYEISEHGIQEVVRHSLYHIILDHCMIWQNKKGEINITFATDFNLVTLNQSKEKIEVSIPNAFINYDHLYPLGSDTDNPQLAIGTRYGSYGSQQSRKGMAIVDLNTMSTLVESKFKSLYSENMGESYVISEYPNKQDILVTPFANISKFFAYIPNVTAHFVKLPIPKSHQKFDLNFLPNGRDSVELWSINSKNKPVRRLYKMNGEIQIQDFPEIDWIGFHSKRFYHPKFGSIYVDVNGHALKYHVVGAKETGQIKVARPDPDGLELEKKIEFIENEEGVPRLVLFEIESLKFHVVALESQLNE